MSTIDRELGTKITCGEAQPHQQSHRGGSRALSVPRWQAVNCARTQVLGMCLVAWALPWGCWSSFGVLERAGGLSGSPFSSPSPTSNAPLTRSVGRGGEVSSAPLT